MVRKPRCSHTWERELTANCCRPAFPLSHRTGYIAVTRCTGSSDIYVTVKGVKCSGKVSRATIGRRLPWFRHPPINAPKQLSPNPDRTGAFLRVATRAPMLAPLFAEMHPPGEDLLQVKKRPDVRRVTIRRYKGRFQHRKHRAKESRARNTVNGESRSVCKGWQHF